jgi:hypothetical protein
MLMLPPRHGKSELASKSYPAWAIGRAGWKQFISASATYELARDWGRDVRNIVTSDEYQTVFPTRLSEDSRAAGKWNTSTGGCYYAVGVGGTILGRGADEVLIDDPFGSIEDARSQVMREKVWSWYTGTIYNRLQPNAAITIIGHRMVQYDCSGLEHYTISVPYQMRARSLPQTVCPSPAPQCPERFGPRRGSIWK